MAYCWPKNIAVSRWLICPVLFNTFFWYFQIILFIIKKNIFNISNCSLQYMFNTKNFTSASIGFPNVVLCLDWIFFKGGAFSQSIQYVPHYKLTTLVVYFNCTVISPYLILSGFLLQYLFSTVGWTNEAFLNQDQRW